MNKIQVSAAIIIENGKVLTAKRGYGKYVDQWEFPGGKLNAGETSEEALHRELMEELSIHVTIEKLFMNFEYDYPDFRAELSFFLCRMDSEEIILNEHKEIRWLEPADLESVEWLPANQRVLHALKLILY